MRYYAMGYEHHGRHAGYTSTDSKGREVLSAPGVVRAFASRDERDAWVDDGNPYLSQPGAREAVGSGNRWVRAAIRDIERAEGRGDRTWAGCLRAEMEGR